MDAAEIRNWLGFYVLLLTAFVGAYFFVAPSAFVPLETSDKIASAEILIPFLLGQVAAVFRFYSAPEEIKHRSINIPVWAVKAPPVLVTGLLIIEFTLMAVGGLTQRADLIPPPESFKALLTFCVALLNASTVFIIASYFEAKSISATPPSSEPPNSERKP